MSPRRHLAVLICCLLGALLIGAGSATAFTMATRPATRPPIVKACGAIHAKGKRLRVDIAEAFGDVSHSCAAARAVMRKFLPRAHPYAGPNGAEVKYKGRTFGCYTSRPDGEGWNYHCMWSASSGDAFIDFGAGRRF